MSQNSITANQNSGNLDEVYTAVRKHVGITDLSDRGKISLSGKEHIKFMQGMLTNDVSSLEPGRGVHAAVLTVKGKMIADMNVYKDESCLFIDTEPGLNTTLYDLFTKYRLSYKADIVDDTETYCLVSMHGKYVEQLLEKFVGDNVELSDLLSFTIKDTSHGLLMITKVNRTGESGYDIYVNADKKHELLSELLDIGEEYRIKTFGKEVLDTLRIEAGIPVYGVDMDENTIPIEAGLWDALNFEKGCYVGQEVIARIKWRGHVNWHLLGFVLEGKSIPDRDDKILVGDKVVGRITSSALSPLLRKPIALGYIRREFSEPDTSVSIEVGGQPTEAVVVKPPFIDLSD